MAAAPYSTLPPKSLCVLASIVFKAISTKFGVKVLACVANEILNLESKDLILGPDSSI